jgi:hypothetical protein
MEVSYRRVQLVSKTPHYRSKEKRLLDSFLAGREHVQDEVE